MQGKLVINILIFFSSLYFQNLRAAVDAMQQSVSDLPTLGQGYEYGSSFPGFLELISVQRAKISSLLGSIYNSTGVKTKFPKLVGDLSKVIESNHHLDEKIVSLLLHITYHHRRFLVGCNRASSN